MKLLSNEWLTAPMDAEAEFEVRPLDALEFIEAQDIFEKDRSAAVRKVLKAVVNWKGIVGADGQPLPFDAEMLPRLGIDICDWLVLEVFKKSRLSGDAEKN